MAFSSSGAPKPRPCPSFISNVIFSKAKSKQVAHGHQPYGHYLTHAHSHITGAAVMSRRDVMPHHVLSARAVEEIYRYIVLTGILISMHRLNSLKCAVTPDFPLIDQFLYQLSTFCEKLKKICVVEVWFFSIFLRMDHLIPSLFWPHGVGKSPS